MADLPPYPDSDGDTGLVSDRESPPSTPRWVKVFGITFIGLVLLVVVVLLVATALGLHTPSLGPGRHGPGRGTPSGDTGSQTMLSVSAVDRILSGGDTARQTSHSNITEHGVKQL